MGDANDLDFGNLIIRQETATKLIASLLNDSNLTLLRHKTSLEMMVTASKFITDNLRVLDRDIRQS